MMNKLNNQTDTARLRYQLDRHRTEIAILRERGRLLEKLSDRYRLDVTFQEILKTEQLIEVEEHLYMETMSEYLNALERSEEEDE